MANLGQVFVGAVKGAYQKLTQVFDVSAQIDRLFDVGFLGVEGTGCTGVDEVVAACEAEAPAP